MSKHMGYFVFLVVTDHTGKEREFVLVDRRELLWSEDKKKALLMAESEASDLATDLNAGCGSI